MPRSRNHFELGLRQYRGIRAPVRLWHHTVVIAPQHQRGNADTMKAGLQLRVISIRIPVKEGECLSITREIKDFLIAHAFEIKLIEGLQTGLAIVEKEVRKIRNGDGKLIVHVLGFPITELAAEASGKDKMAHA